MGRFVLLSVPTTCPFCGCGCGYFLLARDGNLTGVAPSRNHSIAAGRICARGWSAHQAPAWGPRTLRPMVRRGEDLVAVSWDAALDYVADRMRRLVKAARPVGVLGSGRATNEENYLAGRLARAGLQTNNVDFCYHALCGPMMAGLEDVTSDPCHSIYLADVETSDAIVLVEGDLARTHPVAAASVLKAVRRGAKLIAIGCVRTKMSGLASHFLPVEPGSEGQAINGLLAAARDIHAAIMTEPVSQAAEVIAAAENAVFLMGPTCARADQLRSDVAALATLAAISGHPGRPGSGVLLLLDRSNVRGACNAGLAPDRLPGYKRIDDIEARRRVEELWDKPVPRGRGLDAANMLESVAGLLLLADDPVAVLPQAGRARAALERIEFLVVLDAFVTPVMKAAHAVLPIASFAETEGTVTNIEGWVQQVRAAVAPPGEARDGWKVLAGLCERLGAGGSWSSPSDVLQEIESVRQKPALTHTATHARSTEKLTSAERPYVLARSGAFDWGADPLVSFSPTLSRDYVSERKLFPNGFVEMSSEDADALGVRAGWWVKVSSAHGAATVPIRQCKDLRRGVLLVPYGFRDALASVLCEDGVTAVSVERA